MGTKVAMRDIAAVVRGTSVAAEADDRSAWHMIGPHVYPHQTTPEDLVQHAITSIYAVLSNLVTGHIQHQRTPTTEAEHGAVGSGFESLAPHTCLAARTASLVGPGAGDVYVRWMR